MKIVELTKEWLPAAAQLAAENYEEERDIVTALPAAPVLPPLDELAENGLGVAAVDGGELLGFLGAYGPWGPVFCTKAVLGVFSPLHAHAARRQDRERIYQRMYQAAAEKWVRVGAASHAVTLYAHDEAAQKAFFTYGFGMRCIDLVRRTTPLEGEAPSDVTFFELPARRQHEIRPLRKALAEHLAESPCFMRDDPEDVERWLDNRETDPPRVFAAERAGRIIAYMELREDGENFAVSEPGTRSICGAYCLPEYRGDGIAQSLLRHILTALETEGIARLGVDCESFNPTALNFWTKHFTAYTHSLVRRIDENAVPRQ